MTSAPDKSTAVAEILRTDISPLIAVDVENLLIVGATVAFYKLLGREPNSLEKVPITDVVINLDRSSLRDLLRVLTSGALTGYRAVRQLRKGDGGEFTATIWVRLASNESNIAMVKVELGEVGAAFPLFGSNINVALAVTNHDWVIEYVSSDIGVMLGRSPESYKGVALLGLVHPRDVQRFILAVTQVSTNGEAATLRANIRGDNRWLDLGCVIAAMCGHSPPRLGLALATISHLGADVTSERQGQVATRCCDGLDGMNHFRSHMPLGFLSTRQWEILTRLVRGERVRDIASALYLSTSTVRNHLTAVFRKFGVHSQAELLALLLRDSLGQPVESQNK